MKDGKGRPRVVVTGMGWITPLGHDIPTVWGRLVKGESGVSPIDGFKAKTFPTPWHYCRSVLGRDPFFKISLLLPSIFAYNPRLLI